MNRGLLEEIVRHVLGHFAVIPHTIVDLDKTQSLISPGYLLTEKITFESEGQMFHNKVWGCQLAAINREVSVLLAECSVSHVHEWAMIIQPKEAPTYGIYLEDNKVDGHCMLAVSLDQKEWLECNTYLQSTFLAAMEQVRDMRLSWHKPTEYQEHYKSLRSFIKYWSMVREARDARQES
jgi:hypothetical protein